MVGWRSRLTKCSLQYAGEKQQEWRGVSITPAPAPYKCSKTSGEVCRFPFRLHGNLYWDCVERDGTPVCNTKDSWHTGPSGIPEYQYLQSFDSTATFQPCTDCASCPQEGTRYYGVTSSEECQALCQLVTGCNFFNYHKGSKVCGLLYGVGGKVASSEWSFSPKQCSTNRTGNTSSQGYSST
jgi:hypothetical protein